jgi:GR25 family glycosyltransferase involved in LPS biosynthesis
MKVYIIHLKSYNESLEGALKIQSKMQEWGHDVILFNGVNGSHEGVERLKRENRRIDFDALCLNKNHISLIKKPGVIGCFYSHYDLWKICHDTQKEIIIFEDDVILYRDYVPVDYEDILLLSTNFEFTRSDEDYNFKQRYFKPLLTTSTKNAISISYIGNAIPDASCYAIKPSGAKKLLDRYENTYNASDFCINSDVCDIKINSCLMGEASNKKSLTQNL